MSMMSRLTKSDAGTVLLDCVEIGDIRSRDPSKRMAILTQTNNVDMKLTVRELVGFGRFPYSGRRLTPQDREVMQRAIDYMELGQIAEEFIDELSGGQRQRAYIAMVIAQDTQYVLLDEPTNNLDIYHATNLMRMVRRMCRELGKTVVMVLHEINYVAFYSDYVRALKDGGIAAWGIVEQVVNEETLRRIYGVDFKVMQVEGRPLTIHY